MPNPTETTEYLGVTTSKNSVDVEQIKLRAEFYSYPIDGAVFKFDNISYGKTLGQTAHHFKNAIAFKFYDETYETELTNIEWTIGRTGILTPTAIFNPVEIDGCEVERASLHNMSILKETLHSFGWRGQKVEVFKSNMIIPQIYSAEFDDSTTKNYFDYPHVCPICGGPTAIKQDNDSQFLICDNVDCEGKLINKLDYFCGKKGLDIKGLSQATLSKLLDWGWINSFADLYNLNQYRNEWIKKPGFGPKSVDNILTAIENSKNQTLDKFIAALGIPLIGSNMSKELIKHISSYEDFREKIQTGFDFSSIDGFAEAKHKAIHNFNYDEADKVVKYIIFSDNNSDTIKSSMENLTFVITGKVEQFKNRSELQKMIESCGGKVVSSISKNVNYLINNDIESTSSKNVAAKKLGIPIISEKEFLEKF